MLLSSLPAFVLSSLHCWWHISGKIYKRHAGGAGTEAHPTRFPSEILIYAGTQKLEQLELVYSQHGGIYITGRREGVRRTHLVALRPRHYMFPTH